MIVAIGHQKGGVGKSAIAWHIAFALKPDLLVDMDFQESVTSFNTIRKNAGHQPLPVVSMKTEKELLSLIKSDHDSQLVVIDLGGFDSRLNRIVIGSADLVITPIYDRPTEILGLVKFKEILSEIGEQANDHIHSHVLINRVHHSRRNYDNITGSIEKLGFGMMNTKIVDSGSISESVGEGLSLSEFKSTSKHRAIQCFDQLASEVRQLLKEGN